VGRRVLIVDDEPYIRRILSYKLRREGFVTFEAASAEHAESILAEHDVDLVRLMSCAGGRWEPPATSPSHSLPTR
jgi:DNA-binding response OmpR family regulator